MTLVGPPGAPELGPLRRMVSEMRSDRRVPAWPPGDTAHRLSLAVRFGQEPAAVLLEGYERFGPVFTLGLFHGNYIFALGPEANHHMLVANAENYSWRDGHLGDMIPFLGDGLLTIDGRFHRESRRIMLPGFHRQRLAGLVDVVHAETDRALDSWAPGLQLDFEDWTRTLALRIAMRALFGLDPDHLTTSFDPAEEFALALRFWGRGPLVQMYRGPRSAWRRMQLGRERLDDLIYGEIADRRRSGERGTDLLSLLLDAEDEHGDHLSVEHIRDEVITLLFAGHDTATSTIAFLTYALAQAPHERALLRKEIDQRGAAPVDFEALLMGGFPRLELAMEETLRLWPPAWIGPRKSIAADVIAGVEIPAGAHVNYSSLASHRLPDVWPQAEQFDPARFSPERRGSIPKGAYVPFGGGSRTCIGMRFAQLEIRAIMVRLLRDFDLDLLPGWELRTTQLPTISPRDGLPVVISPASR